MAFTVIRSQPNFTPTLDFGATALSKQQMREYLLKAVSSRVHRIGKSMTRSTEAVLEARGGRTLYVAVSFHLSPICSPIESFLHIFQQHLFFFSSIRKTLWTDNASETALLHKAHYK